MSQEPQAAAPATPKKSRKPLVLAAAAVLVLAAGGGGAYFMLAAAPAGETAEPAEPVEPPAIVNLDPFVVNLADPGGSRYLRVTVGLVVAGEEAAAEVSEDDVVKLRVRSALIEMLAQQTSSHLVTADGKAALKTSIAEIVSHSIEHLEVTDVLFSEFIVQ